MTQPDDPVMAEIGEAVTLGHSGETATAARRFTEIWDKIGSDGDALHRCALAHDAADVQDDPSEELRWDLRALEAADEVSDRRAREHHRSLNVAGFYPSLHLNLADVYRRLGDVERAAEHLRQAQRRVSTLADDGYGRLIRDGIARCAARIADEAGALARSVAAGE